MSQPPKDLVFAAVLAVAVHGALLVHFNRSGAASGQIARPTEHQIFYGFLASDLPSSHTYPKQPSAAHPLANSELVRATEQNPPPYSAGLPNTEVNQGYFTEKQVDKAAQLVGDWIINAEPWSEGQVVKMAIKILISAQGKVEHWELTDGSLMTPSIQESLKEIDRTVFSPALRSGRPVASQREVELIIFKD